MKSALEALAGAGAESALCATGDEGLRFVLRPITLQSELGAPRLPAYPLVRGHVYADAGIGDLLPEDLAELAGSAGENGPSVFCKPPSLLAFPGLKALNEQSPSSSSEGSSGFSGDLGSSSNGNASPGASACSTDSFDPSLSSYTSAYHSTDSTSASRSLERVCVLLDDAGQSEKSKSDEKPTKDVNDAPEGTVRLDALDGHGFRQWVAEALRLGVDPALLCRWLGFPVPSRCYPSSLVLQLLDDIGADLLGARYGRLRIPQIASIPAILRLFHFSRRILVVCGAGISVNSGIPDFRSANGIYSKMWKYNLERPTDMFSLDHFRDDPAPFYTFAPEILPSKLYRPTLVHWLFRELHLQGKLLRVYTQNIDCLEARVGVPPEKVVQCHGSFDAFTCLRCGRQFDYQAEVKGLLLRHVEWVADRQASGKDPVPPEQIERERSVPRGADVRRAWNFGVEPFEKRMRKGGRRAAPAAPGRTRTEALDDAPARAPRGGLALLAQGAGEETREDRKRGRISSPGRVSGAVDLRRARGLGDATPPGRKRPEKRKARSWRCDPDGESDREPGTESEDTGCSGSENGAQRSSGSGSASDFDGNGTRTTARNAARRSSSPSSDEDSGESEESSESSQKSANLYARRWRRKSKGWGRITLSTRTKQSDHEPRSPDGKPGGRATPTTRGTRSARSARTTPATRTAPNTRTTRNKNTGKTTRCSLPSRASGESKSSRASYSSPSRSPATSSKARRPAAGHEARRTAHAVAPAVPSVLTEEQLEACQKFAPLCGACLKRDLWVLRGWVLAGAARGALGDRVKIKLSKATKIPPIPPCAQKTTEGLVHHLRTLLDLVWPSLLFQVWGSLGPEARAEVRALRARKRETAELIRRFCGAAGAPAGTTVSGGIAGKTDGKAEETAGGGLGTRADEKVDNETPVAAGSSHTQASASTVARNTKAQRPHERTAIPPDCWPRIMEDTVAFASLACSIIPRAVSIPIEVYPLVEECMVPCTLVDEVMAALSRSAPPPPSPSDQRSSDRNPGFLDQRRQEALTTGGLYVLKPNIVFFGEQLPAAFSQAIELDSRTADMLLVLGSSLRVRPVSGVLGMLPHYVPQIYVNRQPRVPNRVLSHQFDVEFRGDCDDFARWIGNCMGWELGLESTPEEERPRHVPRIDDLRVDISPKAGHKFLVRHSSRKIWGRGDAAGNASTADLGSEGS